MTSFLMLPLGTSSSFRPLAGYGLGKHGLDAVIVLDLQRGVFVPLRGMS